MLDEMLELFSYNRWAHDRTLTAAEQLDADQFTRALGGGFPSVQATLEHLLQVEWVWLGRWQGNPLGGVPSFVSTKDLGSLRAGRRALEDAQDEFFRTLTDSDLSRPIAIITRSKIETEQRLGDTMRHVVNHASYHRGQVATMLRQLGAVPTGTDLFTYLYESSRAAASSSAATR
jgi:uncharacterized damage-inducible protein DinB